MPATEQTTTGAAAAAGATSTSSNSEEVILALQRERKNQYLSFKKFGEFKNMSSIKSKGKLTALGYIYVCISAIVFLLYWFVDAVDGRYASVLLLASCFVVRVHPAFSSATGKLRWWEMWEDTLFGTSKRLGCSSISSISSNVVKQSLTTTTTIGFERASAWVCLCVF